MTAVICGPRTMEQWDADLTALRKPLFTAEDFRTIATESHWRPDCSAHRRQDLAAETQVVTCCIIK